MQRKRDGLVPIGETFGGPAKKNLQPTPQSRHHFTQADPIGASWRERWRCAHCPAPNPGNRHQYKRANGPFQLVMVAGADNKLPYGNLPRLILAWICTEAVKTRSRELVLGKSLSKFMRTFGIYNTGGKPQTRLRNQMKRLFGCTVSMIYEDEYGEQFVSSLIAERGEFWWSKRSSGGPKSWPRI